MKIRKYGKRIASLLIAVLILASVMPLCVLTVSAVDLSGSGTEDDPYIISTADDLKTFAYELNYNGLDTKCYARLNANITINSGINFTESGSSDTTLEYWDDPICKDELNPFMGVFDGNGHYITGLYYYMNSAEAAGLFGYTSGAEIKNLTVVNSYIKADKNAGAFVGDAYDTTLKNCMNKNTYVISENAAGGLVGAASDLILSECSNTETVKSITDGVTAGGFVGKIKSMATTDRNIIENCVNTYELASSGGIIGSADSETTVYNSVTNGCVVYSTLANAGMKNTYYTSDKPITYDWSSASTVENSEQVTSERLESGEIAYKLSQNAANGIWGQRIGTDKYPVIGGTTVYYGINSEGIALYSNEPVSHAHKFNPNSGKCSICGAYQDEMSALYGHSATLGGNIGLNFIMEIDEEYQNDDTSMNFSVVYNDYETDEQKEIYTQSIPFKDAEVITVDGKNYYKFTCNTAAKEMTCAITGQLVNGDKQGTEFTSSVADYAYTLLYSENATDSTQKLIKAMLNYGAYSQEYFGFYTDYLANCDLSDDEKQLNNYNASYYSDYKSEYKQINENTDIGYYGNSLVLETNTEVKHYFTFDSTKTNFDDITYTCTDSSGAEYEADIESKQWGDNGFYVKITDIPPHLYSKRLTVTVSVGGEEQCSISFTPVSYFYSVLNAYPEDDGVHDSLRNVVKAYYQYGLEASVYKINS